MRLRRAGTTIARALAALFALWAGGAAAADSLRLRYDVYGSGFHVMAFDVAIEEAAGAYRVASALQTQGVADTLLGFRMEARAAGALGALHPAPSSYETASTWRRKERRTAVEFRGAAAPIVALSPPKEEEELTPVPPASLANTVDPLTAGLRAARTAAASGSCRQSIPVFDGRRRYDLHLADLGERQVKRSRYSAYEGVARACRVQQERIGGFVRKDSQDDVSREAILYVAQVLPNTPPVPVRMEMETGWGWLYIHLAEIAGSDGQVRLSR